MKCPNPRNIGIMRMVSIALACVCLVQATSPVSAQTKQDAKEADKFRTQGEQVTSAIEKTRDQLQRTMEAYDALLEASDKKLQASHKKLTQEVAKTEKAVEEGRKHVTAFKETAEGFFVTWQAQMDSITNESIRKASAKRLKAAQAGFQNMSDNLVKAREVYEPFIATLHEQATLLMQDLSVETVTTLREEVAPDVHSQAEALFASIEAILAKGKVDEKQVNQVLAEEESEVGTGADEADMDDDTGMGDDGEGE